MDHINVCIIGGGVVGLAIGKKLSKITNTIVLEKEKSIFTSTSSRNSEVIHSGIYYKTNSLKHTLCLEGNKELYRYCLNKKIKHSAIGKLIIADDSELDKLSIIFNQGKKNQVSNIKFLEKKDILKIEPNIRAQHAIFSETTGIVDTHELGVNLENDIINNNSYVLKNSKFLSAEQYESLIKISIKNPDNTLYEFTSNVLINSAGLDSVDVDNKINLFQNRPKLESFPVKGNYFSYSGKNTLNHLIYPIPNKYGLGIHSTIDTSGALKFGPDVELNNSSYLVSTERKNNFEKSIIKWWPDFDAKKLQPSYSGFRPKIKVNEVVSDDFLIFEDTISNNVLISLHGIESPGITASFAIANRCLKYINNNMFF
jgi:L-2-hydroxyglutarate oxidase LhgO